MCIQLGKYRVINESMTLPTNSTTTLSKNVRIMLGLIDDENDDSENLTIDEEYVAYILAKHALPTKPILTFWQVSYT
jgi:hypothetical protein